MKRSWTDSTGVDSRPRVQVNAGECHPTRDNSVRTDMELPRDFQRLHPPRSLSFGTTQRQGLGDEAQTHQAAAQLAALNQSSEISPPPPRSARSHNSAPAHRAALNHDVLPAITRKVTACAACRYVALHL